MTDRMPSGQYRSAGDVHRGVRPVGRIEEFSGGMDPDDARALALAGSIVLGPRIGRKFKRDGGGPMMPHDLTIACSGPVAMELQHLSAEVLARINQFFGTATIRDLRKMNDLVAGTGLRGGGNIKVGAGDRGFGQHPPLMHLVLNSLYAAADLGLAPAMAVFSPSSCVWQSSTRGRSATTRISNPTAACSTVPAMTPADSPAFGWWIGTAAPPGNTPSDAPPTIRTTISSGSTIRS